MNASPAEPPGPLRRHPLAVATLLAIALLAGINWYQDPTRAGRWLTSMLMLPLAWLCLSLSAGLMRRRRPPATTDAARANQKYFDTALTLIVIGIGAVQIARLGLGIWVRFGDHGADLELERRILGIASAAVVVTLGNTLPKILTPLSMLPANLAQRVTSARRFIGVSWVVLGVAMSVGFIAMPMPVAVVIARSCAALCLASMVAGIVWMNAGPARGEP